MSAKRNHNGIENNTSVSSGLGAEIGISRVSWSRERKIKDFVRVEVGSSRSVEFGAESTVFLKR